MCTAHCNSSRYANVAVVWIDYVCKYMNSKEVNMLLKDFLRHVSPNRAYAPLAFTRTLCAIQVAHVVNFFCFYFFLSRRYEKCQDQIQGMCLKVCSRFQTFGQLVTMDFFMPVVDLCLGKKKVTVCKASRVVMLKHESIFEMMMVVVMVMMVMMAQLSPLPTPNHRTNFLY